MATLKTTLYHFLKPYYRAIIDKLIADFQINERNHALAIANVSLSDLHAKLDLLATKHNDLLALTQANNALSGGLYTGIAEIVHNQMLAETYEIIDILSGAPPLDTSVVSSLATLPASVIKDRSILLVGGNNQLYLSGLKKLGAKKITTVSFTPTQHSLTESAQGYTLHPADLGKLTVAPHDLLFAPNHSVASLLIKHQLFALSGSITHGGFFFLQVASPTLKSSQPYFKSELEGSTLIYSDALARKLIHESGFVEVVTKDNSAIKKSRFSYHKGLSVIKNTYSSHMSGTQTILYSATKLPNL